MPLWALIAIGSVALITLAFLIYICCASRKNRKARRNAEIQLALEMEKAEASGYLPDELKKAHNDA